MTPDIAPARRPTSNGDNIEEGNVNADGTYHQAQLGLEKERKHFFAPIDSSYADAVHRDAATVEYTEEDEKGVKRKIDRTVLLLVVCSYVFNQFGEHPDNFGSDFQLMVIIAPRSYQHRTSSGNAHIIAAFNKNYGITNNDKWTIALSIFYVGYCLLEMPANILQRRIGANRFFFIALMCWGTASLSFVYAKGYAALLVLRQVSVPIQAQRVSFPFNISRVILGIGEAGYYAGMIYYLSFWYKRYELAMRISLCMTGTLPGAIGGLFAFGLVRAHTSQLAGWQFLFLIEAIPTLIMAVAILLFLPSFPFTASFLTPHERAIAQARLNRDHKPQSHGGMTGWKGFKAIVGDPNAWLFTLVYASFNVGVATVSYFLPTLIKGLGFSSINAQGLTVAPYAVGWFMVFFQAWHSDRTRDRGWHVMLSCSVSFIGYVILATSVHRSVGAAYFALFLVVGGNYSLYPLELGYKHFLPDFEAWRRDRVHYITLELCFDVRAVLRERSTIFLTTGLIFKMKTMSPMVGDAPDGGVAKYEADWARTAVVHERRKA
ncbi:hypothetical protein D9615_003370 [Tricholomella constricta]|uniref:Major facilitator superfamily (MFS) profile domain-containing protein n=1 Tax=Tricholomella constricta TaxID=117010 RepID=A0A8H5HJ63_9AGAR|nr:hypothetical protein D9615_003370 [Tricholomella constricta]